VAPALSPEQFIASGVSKTLMLHDEAPRSARPVEPPPAPKKGWLGRLFTARGHR
jgi:hypothetical protein